MISLQFTKKKTWDTGSWHFCVCHEAYICLHQPEIKQCSTSPRSGPVTVIVGAILATLVHELRDSGSFILLMVNRAIVAGVTSVSLRRPSPCMFFNPFAWRPSRRSTHVRVVVDVLLRLLGLGFAWIPFESFVMSVQIVCQSH